jgi:hypothetical protein
MAKRYNFNERCETIAVITCIVALCSLILSSICIITGPFVVIEYVSARNNYRLYTKTECRLLNYTFRRYQSTVYGESGASQVICFDEQFSISYKISNGTTIFSSIVSERRNKRHEQTQV